MNRRTFLKSSAAASGVVAPGWLSSCGGGLPDGREIVATPEQRRTYLDSMLEELCTEPGPHPWGSPEYDAAASAVKREMKRSLPSVFYDTLTHDRWVLKSEPLFRVGRYLLETWPAHGTRGTPPAGITGLLEKTDAGPIRYIITDPDTRAAIGRVAISEAWATGLAVSRPWTRYDDKPGGLPTFNLGEDAVQTLDWGVLKSVPATGIAEVDFIPDVESNNVIGTIPGESTDEIVVYAHLDTVYNSPGANDNTASVIVMLMLAHALSGERPKKTLTFMATTGEEYGYLGTKHYAKRRLEEGTLGNIKLIMNFDSLTWGGDLVLITEDGDLISLARDIRDELALGGDPQWREEDGLGRETLPLKEAGVNARGLVVDSLGGMKRVWHRPEDTPETVSRESAEYSFRLFSGFLRRVQEMV